MLSNQCYRENGEKQSYINLIVNLFGSCCDGTYSENYALINRMSYRVSVG